MTLKLRGIWPGWSHLPGTTTDLGDSLSKSGTTVLTQKWPVLGRHRQAVTWLGIWTELGRAPRTIDAYARGLAEYLELCEREGVDPVTANRAHIAVYVRELTERPSRRGGNVVSLDSGSGLSNATIQQRIVPVRLFYDYLMEEGLRDANPVGRGRYTPGRHRGGHQRGLVPRLTKLPWIPNQQQWLDILAAAAEESIRNRVMLALAYDAALRREELCSLGTDDLDPAHRTLRIRAETTKNRLERVVPYSASTGALLRGYLAHRARISRARGPLWLSESRRNHAQPPTLWTWSKVIRRIGLAAGVPRFSTHTLRHLCLTDLARMGWELHAIATFAGHRTPTPRLPTSTCPAGTWPTSSPRAWSTSMPGASRCSPASTPRRRRRRREHHGDRTTAQGRLDLDGPRFPVAIAACLTPL